jgi:hypothetical protein
MKVQKIKKDFLKLAHECINAASLPTADGGIVVGRFAAAPGILIRGTFSLHGDVVETYKTCLNTAVAEMMARPKDSLNGIQGHSVAHDCYLPRPVCPFGDCFRKMPYTVFLYSTSGNKL